MTYKIRLKLTDLKKISKGVVNEIRNFEGSREKENNRLGIILTQEQTQERIASTNEVRGRNEEDKVQEHQK